MTTKRPPAPPEDSDEYLVYVRQQLMALRGAQTAAGGEPVSNARIAQEAGINASALSGFLNDKYQGDSKAVARRLLTWIRSQSRRKEAATKIADEIPFVMTHTSTRIWDALTYAEMTGDICLIYGGAGTGKTIALREYAAQNTGVCMATMTSVSSTVRGALEVVAQCLGVSSRATAQQLYRDLVDRLRAAEYKLIIVDEAQHLTERALDQLRAFSDELQVGLVLAGNREVYSRMTGGTRAAYLDRLYSRVGYRLHLGKVDARDLSAILQADKIDDDGIRKELSRIANLDGGLRQAAKTLRLAKTIAIGAAEALTVSHVRRAWKTTGGDL